MASASTTSLLLAPPRFPCQIAGRPTPAPTNPLRRLPVPAPAIRPRRRFAAARCEAALVPSWLRAPPRRRNVLREKASPAPPPPPAEHQVRPLDSHHQLNRDRPLAGGTGEPQSVPSDDPALLPDLDDKLEDFECLDAGRSGDVVARPKLDWDAEEGHFCGAGTGPVFIVHEAPDGNAVRVEVNEDEIVSRCATADGEVSADLQSMLSRARVMAKEFESGEREVPRNSSLVRFVAVEKRKSCAVDAEVSVVQTNGASSSRAVAWSAFAAVCGVCILLIASKMAWRNLKARLSGKVFGIPIPGMKAGQLDKGNIKVIGNVHMFPGDLLGRPQLERSQLMSNLKKAKESRQRFSFRNVFSCNTVANENDASITHIRRMVTDVHTLEEGTLSQRNGGKDGSGVFPHSVVADVHALEGSLSQRNAGKNSSVVFQHPVVAIEEEISASYVRQSAYHHDVSEFGSSELRDTSLSNDIIHESVEQSMDFKNVASSVVKSQFNVGEIEQPEPRYNDESTTDEKDMDINYGTHATEKEAHICFADGNNMGPNTIDTLSAEFERKEHFAEIPVSIQGLQLSAPFSCDKQMVYKNDNAHEISSNVVPKSADEFSPNCFNISSSGLENGGACMSNTENDINCMQEVEANNVQTANCEDFVHHVSRISKEACRNLVMSDISTIESPQGISEDPDDLVTDNMQPMREPELCNHDGKQMIYATAKEHKIDIVHNETKTSSEIYSTGALIKASTSPLYALQEETVQHEGVKVSILEKEDKIPSSNKEARAYLYTDESKLQKQMLSDKVLETKLSAQGVPGTSIMVGSSNGVQKAKRVAHKRRKKVQSNQESAGRVAEQDIVQNGSIVDQENSSQNVKRRKRKNQTNAFLTQGSQTKEETLERSLVPSLPDDAPKAENMKPLGETGSSAGSLSSKDMFSESQPSRFIDRSLRMEELKLDFQTSERLKAAATETKTNMHDYNVMHERSTEFNVPKTKMGVTAAKKSTKRESSSKRTNSSNPASNKDSEEPTSD